MTRISIKNFNSYIILFFSIFLLSGCSVTYNVVGMYDNFNEVYNGTVVHNLSAGRGNITAVGEQSGKTCSGYSYVTYKPVFSLGGCSGQRGKAPLQCTDGTTIDIDWEATSCTTGFGVGKDSKGRRFRFAFGSKGEETAERLQILRQKAAVKPGLETSETR